MARSQGKIVIVTGAASGIGEGAARRFAKDGATLVLGDKDSTGLQALADDLAPPPLRRAKPMCRKWPIARRWSHWRSSGSDGSTFWSAMPGSIISASWTEAIFPPFTR